MLSIWGIQCQTFELLRRLHRTTSLRDHRRTNGQVVAAPGSAGVPAQMAPAAVQALGEVDMDGEPATRGLVGGGWLDK